MPDRLLETHLARLLFDAQRERRSGVLVVEEGAVRTRLHLSDGRVIFAEHGSVSETLGRLLMRQGAIDRDEYLLILEHMAEPSDRDEVMRFGEVAIQLGMLGAAELSEALALQVKLKLQHCLQLDDATWTWLPDAAARTTTPFPTPLEPALLTALREDPQNYRWMGLLAALRNRRVHLSQSADEIAPRFGLSPAALRFVRTIDGRPLANLLAARIVEPEELGAVLCSLLLAGVLAIGEHVSDRRQAPARPKPEVAVISREERAQQAAARLREEMKRRGHTKPQTLDGIDVGADSGTRARLEAERAFEKGKRLMSQGAVDAARDSFERAVTLLPEAADYALHLRWAQYLGADDATHRFVHEQELRAAVLEALAQDKRLAFAHYVQGRLFLIDGDEKAAERALALAARLDPHDVETERYLRVLRRRH